MIKSLSPYYITVPFVNPVTSITCEAYVLRMYVWDGDEMDLPLEPIYTSTKQNSAGSTGTNKINISRLLNDFIDFMPTSAMTTSIIDGENQKWATVTVSYINAETETLPYTLVETLLVKGYSYGMDGENAQPPADRVMMQGREFKVNRTGVFNVPIFIL